MDDLSGLEQLCRQVYGAYEYLRDNDLSAVSGTSKRLRSGDNQKLNTRIAEELMELHGVIEGTHVHEGFDQDIILEGYEVIYWSFCWAVANKISYEKLVPHERLQKGFSQPIPTVYLLDGIKSLESYKNITDDLLLPTIFSLVGNACAINGTNPSRLLERDIAEMRQKNYLKPYWNSLETNTFRPTSNI
jgi:hypothetical protein